MVSTTHKSSNSSDGEALPQLISNKTLAYIHQLLQERPLFFYFENDIEVRFYAKRAEEYRRLLSMGKMLFLILYALITTVAILAFPEAVMANDLFIFKYVLTPIGLLLLLVMALADLPFLGIIINGLPPPSAP